MTAAGVPGPDPGESLGGKVRRRQCVWHVGRVCAGLTPWRILLCAALMLGAVAAAQAQIRVDVPTMLVGSPTFSGCVQWPDVAVSTDGTAVFLWSENGQTATDATVTHAYSSTAVALGSPVRVNQSGHSYFSNIASDGRGGFVAAWDWSENQANDQVIARRLDGRGNGLGSQLVVNQDRPTNTALLNRVAGLPSGFVFMWAQDNALWIRMYDPSGTSRGGSTMMADNAFPLNVTSDVVPLSDGGFAAAWADIYGGRSFARIFDGSGTPRGSVFDVSDDFDMQALASYPGGWAAIGTTSNREWSDPPPPVYTSNRILVRRFSNDGVPQGDEILVADAGYRVWLQTDLVYDARGNLYTTWVGLSWDSSMTTPPYARAFDPTGNALGPAVAVSDKMGYDVHPAALPDGRVVNVWQGYRNVPYECTVYANWVDVCAADDTCEALPTATATATPSPTLTPVPTPGCGDGTRDANEECDDGNRTNGDGCDAQCRVEVCGDGRLEGNEQCDPPKEGGPCRADCTLAPAHDSVMVPEKPIDVVIPSGQDSVTKIVPMQVRNADVEPEPERPGHVIHLLASDGDCPAGTIAGLPDFERGMDGDQDSILVPGGTPRTALVTVFASRQAFPDLDEKIPHRCTLVFTAVTLVDGNVDPTPENNTVTVELNVRAAGKADNPAAAAGASAATQQPGFFIRSVNPLKVNLALGRTSKQKVAKVKVRNGLAFGSADQQVQLSTDDGTCPPGTVVINDFGGSAGGNTLVTLRAGGAQAGKLMVTINGDVFTSPNSRSPARCIASVLVTDSSGTEKRTNQRTALVIEVTDRNDLGR
jgi:cysteine-rich repeat protein